MRSIRARAEIAAALALALGLAGCSNELPAPLGSRAESGKPPSRGGVLQLATFGDIRSLDPANISDGLAPQVHEQLYAGLIDYDRESKIRPGIASHWRIEDEGKTYRFFLREGVRFHDGEELVADDIKRSAERSLDGSAPNPFASYYSSIVGFSELNAKKAETLSGVEVEGKYVVTFHLKEPDATFLYVLALLPLRPVCRSAGTRYSDSWAPCGAGPFKLPPGGWQRGHTLSLVRHDAYYEPGLPYLDGVRWTVKENQNSQMFRFLRGDLDLIRDEATPDLLRFQADPRWKPFADFGGGAQIHGEAMNVEMPPFDNVEIRRAVAAALDRSAIQQLRASNLVATNQLIPPGVFGHDPNLVGQHTDYAAALEHMRRAGYPYDPATKTGGWPHAIPYTVYKQGLPEFTAQVLAQQLEKIGLRIEIRVVNYPTFMALRGRRKTSAFGPGFWLQDYPDGLSFLEPMFHSKSISEEDSNNWSFYNNPRYDELVDRSHRELDDERRKKLYTEAQTILIDDAPWAFSQNMRYYTQRQGYVRDDFTHPLWMQQLARTWLDRAAGPSAARALFGDRGLAAIFGPPKAPR
jgi:ABC-type transport system substrate-binding protein